LTHGEKITSAIAAFSSGVTYRSSIGVALEECLRSLKSVSPLQIEKSACDAQRLKRIEGLYTIQSERDVFNTVFHREKKERTRMVNEESGLDFFML
jgi:hypothetical protein